LKLINETLIYLCIFNYHKSYKENVFKKNMIEVLLSTPNMWVGVKGIREVEKESNLKYKIVFEDGSFTQTKDSKGLRVGERALVVKIGDQYQFVSHYCEERRVLTKH